MSLPASCKALMDIVDTPDLFNIPAKDLLPAQLAAAQDLFDERKEQIEVLRQRAADEGVTRIQKTADLVPLMFSHTTYKSYPEAFIAKGRWPQLTKWLQTLSAVPVEADLTGIQNVDDWVHRMWESGNFIYATSGTSGKCSFLNHTAADRAFAERGIWAYYGWPKPDRLKPKRRYYLYSFGQGPQAPMHWFNVMGDIIGQPNARFVMVQDPLKVSELNRIGAMRKAMAEGTATPDDIATFEQESNARTAKTAGALRAMVKDMAEHRDEPIYINGWQVMYDILQELKALGVKEGEFKDVEVFGLAKKRVNGPMSQADLQEKALRFFGNPPHFGCYGMTELSLLMPECEAGRYHLLPWILTMALDRNGNTMQEPVNGVSEGRAAFVDLSREARWGGIITADKITIDHSPTCACGRPGPVILDSVSRYSDKGEDKVDCAGTFDSYVRGLVEN